MKKRKRNLKLTKTSLSRRRIRVADARTDWDTQPLGLVPDLTLARNTGTSSYRVRRERRRRGIKLFKPTRHDGYTLVGAALIQSLTARVGYYAVMTFGEIAQAVKDDVGKYTTRTIHRGLKYLVDAKIFVRIPGSGYRRLSK